jgi:hypothetical protein
MATFGSTPPRDPLSEMKLAISDLEMLHADALATFEDLNASWAVSGRKEASQPRAERREPISQARRDDEALPRTRFGDYPD